MFSQLLYTPSKWSVRTWYSDSLVATAAAHTAMPVKPMGRPDLQLDLGVLISYS